MHGTMDVLLSIASLLVVEGVVAGIRLKRSRSRMSISCRMSYSCDKEAARATFPSSNASNSS